MHDRKNDEGFIPCVFRILNNDDNIICDIIYLHNIIMCFVSFMFYSTSYPKKNIYI